jgi:hypothetical protein
MSFLILHVTTKLLEIWIVMKGGWLITIAGYVGRGRVCAGMSHERDRLGCINI